MNLYQNQLGEDVFVAILYPDEYANLWAFLPAIEVRLGGWRPLDRIRYTYQDGVTRAPRVIDGTADLSLLGWSAIRAGLTKIVVTSRVHGTIPVKIRARVRVAEEEAEQDPDGPVRYHIHREETTTLERFKFSIFWSAVYTEYKADPEWLDFSTVYIMVTGERLSWRQLYDHVEVTSWEQVLNAVHCVVVVPS